MPPRANLHANRPISYHSHKLNCRIGTSMPDAAVSVQLTETEAACLKAIKDGQDRKTRIAVRIKRDLRTVTRALEILSRAHLIWRADSRRWRPTQHGLHCAVRVVPDPPRRRGGTRFGRHAPGSTVERLQEALDRPISGADLVDRLGVTRQRVHQLVVRLHALGRVRLGDLENILHIVARGDDPTLLLTRDEERILSVLPDEAATSAHKLAERTSMSAVRAGHSVCRLCNHGLIEETRSARDRWLYRLTPKGRAHFQRRASAQRADPAPLAVRSDRVRNVLSYLKARREARIRDVRDGLGITQTSMNALMQYLKRKGLVTKSGPELSAPYRLTTEGRGTLQEMIRRDWQQHLSAA